MIDETPSAHGASAIAAPQGSAVRDGSGLKCFECDSPLNGPVCPVCGAPQSAADEDKWIAAKDVPEWMEGQSAWVWREQNGGFNPAIEWVPPNFSRHPDHCEGIWRFKVKGEARGE